MNASDKKLLEVINRFDQVVWSLGIKLKSIEFYPEAKASGKPYTCETDFGGVDLIMPRAACKQCRSSLNEEIARNLEEFAPIRSIGG